jgi:hypothetical protein
MARKTKKETQNMFKSIAILLRNTTWKCGRIERLVIRYLQNHISKNGTSWPHVREMVNHFRLQGKQKSEFLDALRRLEKRHIIRIEGL